MGEDEGEINFETGSRLCTMITLHSGPGFKPTVAGRDAGVEPTGMTSQRVGVSLVRL